MNCQDSCRDFLKSTKSFGKTFIIDKSTGFSYWNPSLHPEIINRKFPSNSNLTGVKID